MKIAFALLLFGLLTVASCDSDNPSTSLECPVNDAVESIENRNFSIGFSTWSYDITQEAANDTYSFIERNADIYSEQIDNKIPWGAWIDGAQLPSEFISDIQNRVDKKLENHKLLLSISLLNTDRSDLLEDYDGSIPSYTSLSEKKIEDAYIKHIQYLVQELSPDYLILAMEVNDLKINAPEKWNEYVALMGNVRSRIRSLHPNLPLSESITLHNWYEPKVNDQRTFISDIANYINQNLDFAAISFYPFFKGLHTQAEFQKALDFLHDQVSIPIAFVETTHLAEDLVIESLSTDIKSDPCEQNVYLETLALNAASNDYHFIIWWTYRDYDYLWQKLPAEVKDIGQVWRDTGLFDEDGNERPTYHTWISIFNK